MRKTRYKRRFRRLILTAGCLLCIGLAAAAVALVRYSATGEKVCEQCHAELIARWKDSQGHPANRTGCAQCHAEGHALLPTSWNVARHIRDLIAPPAYFADDAVTAVRCLDCHPEVLVPGYRLKKQIVHINHRIHHQEGLTCVQCHRAAGHQYQRDGSNRPTAAECLNCHIQDFTGPPRSQKCFGCHDVLLIPGRML